MINQYDNFLKCHIIKYEQASIKHGIIVTILYIDIFVNIEKIILET